MSSITSMTIGLQNPVKMNWRKAMKIVLKRSVVTGVPEILQARNLSKFLRICVFIFCIGGFLYYTVSFLMVYWKYPTVMDVVVDYPEEIEIPAITICDYNGLSAKSFCLRYPEMCSPYKNYSAFCNENFYFCDGNYKYDSNILVST
ncbi:unnamed protein product [Larinioides sclopetarius]|uniref:Sodium channel protein Nach n=1 Tax=Larinioides sclopetarius TaxID=280406 RepID=A0AAV1YVI8_9ARAC